MHAARRNVIKITQMTTPNRWCLDLACGHEVFVTSKDRPATTTARCFSCEQGPEPKHPADYHQDDGGKGALFGTDNVE
jgi:hypothetical protein